MKIRYVLYYFSLCFILVISRVSVYAENNVTEFETPKMIAKKAATNLDIKCSGLYPVVYIKYMDKQDTKFEYDINKQIENKVKEKIELAVKSKAKAIDFSYEIKIHNAIVSILLYTKTTSSILNNEVDSFNYNSEKNTFVTISDFFGPNSSKLLSQYIAAQIKKEPEKYISGFAGITEEQAFYPNGENVVLLFDSFEIAAGTEDIYAIVMANDTITNVLLPSNKIITKKELYSLKMIPLRLYASN